MTWAMGDDMGDKTIAEARPRNDFRNSPFRERRAEAHRVNHVPVGPIGTAASMRPPKWYLPRTMMIPE